MLNTSPGDVCRAACTATSKAAPRTNTRCAPTEPAFAEVTFNPRAAVLHEQHDTRTSVVGQELALPVVLAPAGYIRLAHRDGEVGARRAAGAMGTAVGVSTLSYYPIEAVAAASTGPVWYQLYFAGGRPGAEIAIERAQAAGCRASSSPSTLPPRPGENVRCAGE